jgi:hypothetical protein
MTLFSDSIGRLPISSLAKRSLINRRRSATSFGSNYTSSTRSRVTVDQLTQTSYGSTIANLAFSPQTLGKTGPSRKRNDCLPRSLEDRRDTGTYRLRRLFNADALQDLCVCCATASTCILLTCIQLELLFVIFLVLSYEITVISIRCSSNIPSSPVGFVTFAPCSRPHPSHPLWRLSRRSC